MFFFSGPFFLSQQLINRSSKPLWVFVVNFALKCMLFFLLFDYWCNCLVVSKFVFRAFLRECYNIVRCKWKFIVIFLFLFHGWIYFGLPFMGFFLKTCKTLCRLKDWQQHFQWSRTSGVFSFPNEGFFIFTLTFIITCTIVCVLLSLKFFFFLYIYWTKTECHKFILHLSLNLWIRNYDFQSDRI